MFVNDNFFNDYSSYGLCVVFLNVLIYIILTVAVFNILFIIDSRSFNFLNSLKALQGVYAYLVFVILFVASMAGIPPLLGFVGKFYLFIYLLSVESFFLFFIFLVLNFFALYFYIQNFRFMVGKNSNVLYNSFKYSFNITDSYLWVGLVLMFINIFGFLYMEDVFYMIVFWISFL